MYLSHGIFIHNNLIEQNLIEWILKDIFMLNLLYTDFFSNFKEI